MWVEEWLQAVIEKGSVCRVGLSVGWGRDGEWKLVVVIKEVAAQGQMVGGGEGE